MDQKNLILALTLSVAILFGYQILFVPEQRPVSTQQAQQIQQPSDTIPQTPMMAPNATHSDVPIASSIPTPGSQTVTQRTAVLSQSPRIKIESPRLAGSIALKGARIDDVIILDYRETLAENSANITFLSPKNTQNAYYTEYGWVASSDTPVRLPDAETLWTADRHVLRPGVPVTLSWNNGKGLIFKRVIALDDDYMFTLTQSVENRSNEKVQLFPYGLILRNGTPETTNFYILHEGPLGVFNKTLDEMDYEDLRDEKTKRFQTTGGWIGITDKYWLAALIPDQTIPVSARYIYNPVGGKDRYQTDYLGTGMSALPGNTIQITNHLFAGAKEVHLLDRYAEEMGIVNFDLAIDFGWFYWITKPLFLALLWLHKYVGNLGVAILLLTIAIKLAFFPLANKSYKAMSKMKTVQPKMKKLQERFKDDRVRLNQEMMTLYKKEKVNPASGCLPMLIQIPVFFALYKVLFVTIEMRHAPFFGWIKDLSAPDPTTIFNLFGLIPWDPPVFLMIGVWPLIMGLSMFLQQKLNPAPADPIQAKIFLFLPILFTFMLASFPAGLVIYWAWNNVLSIAQQWTIMKRMGVSA